MASVSSRDNLEAALASNRQASYAHVRKNLPLSMLLALTYESIGVVYGDIGTSPLYVYATIFSDGLNRQEDLIGALSLIIWTLLLSPLLKYCWVVLWCDDNGEGGTFAIYGLLARHVNIMQHRGNVKDNHNLSQYTLENEVPKNRTATSVKNFLEGNEYIKYSILTLTLLGTCLVIGDGVLTPAQSVLSAIGGIINPDPTLSQNVVVGVSIAILATLFIFQRYGSAVMGFTFAPIVISFLSINAAVGIWNLARYDAWFVFKAFSPHYGILFLTRNGKAGWIRLGGVFLAITGSEAMYADLGHFSAKAISMAFTFFVYPSLVITYIGQAAWLTNPDNAANVGQTYYLSIPQTRGLYWPIFVVATAAAAVASQAMISATFSIVSQSMALGCFPRVKVMHTSSTVKGQIYIPEINYILAALTLIVTGVMGQNGTTTIANAYGIAVSGQMVITTIMVTLVLICVKQKPVYIWLSFFAFYFFFDGVYLSSNLYKVPQDGWVPLAFAGAFLTVMSVWRYGTAKKYEHDLEHKLSLDWVTTTLVNEKVARVPGVGLFYSNLMSGVPAIFSHFLANVPALHEVVLFVAVKHVEVPNVAPEERCLFRRLGPLKARMYRCVLRYGYNDVTREQARTMTDQLMEALALYIRTEDPSTWTTDGQASPDNAQPLLTRNGEPLAYDSAETKAMKEAEVRHLQLAQEAAVIHIIGRSYMKAADGTSIKALFNKVVIDYLFYFLKVNTRDAVNTLAIPQENILEVGMVVKV